MKIGLIVVAVLLLVGMGACSKFVSVRNDLVTQREAVTAAWAQVDVALQRRADLIPNLVETVKGFASHETEVFKNIARRPRRAGRRPHSAGKDRRQRPVVRRALPPAGDQRKLSATPVQREFPAAAG